MHWLQVVLLVTAAVLLPFEAVEAKDCSEKPRRKCKKCCNRRNTFSAAAILCRATCWNKRADAWRDTLIAWYSVHLLLFSIVHVILDCQTTYNHYLLITMFHFTHLACSNATHQLTTWSLDDVQAWRNNDDWQLINNTRLWLAERIQGPRNQSIMPIMVFDYAIKKVLTHDDTAIFTRSRGEWLTPPTSDCPTGKKWLAWSYIVVRIRLKSNDSVRKLTNVCNDGK